MNQFIVPASIAISVLSPIISGLFFYNKIKATASQRANVLLFAIHSQLISQARSWFFNGKVISKSIFVEGDGETVDHYEDVYRFKPSSNISRNALEIVNFLILICTVGGLAFSWYFLSKNQKEKDDDDNDYVENDWRINFLIIIKLVVATALIICLLDMPYWYYQVVRFLVAIGCIYLAAGEYKKDSIFTWLFFVVVGILFNPIDPIYFTRLLWNVIDICVGVIFLAGAVKEYIDSK